MVDQQRSISESQQRPASDEFDDLDFVERGGRSFTDKKGKGSDSGSRQRPYQGRRRVNRGQQVDLSANQGSVNKGLAGQGEDPEPTAYDFCLRSLARAPRTRSQLAQAMDRRGVPAEVASSVLARLTEEGLVNDELFAKAWVDSRRHSRGLANRALSAELRRRGVDDETITAVLKDVTFETEAAAARALVERKLTSPTMAKLDSITVARRLVGMLARKGYSAGLSFRVVREVMAATRPSSPCLCDEENESLA